MSNIKFGKLFAIVALALVLVSVGVFGLNTQNASAHTSHQQQVTGTQCTNFDNGHYGLGYYARLNGQFCYDGSRAWVTRVDCSYVYYGFSVSITYCGITHNNDGWAEVGSNYQVSAFFNGFPISYPSYTRVRFWYNGQIGAYGGR